MDTIGEVKSHLAKTIEVPTVGSWWATLTRPTIAMEWISWTSPVPIGWGPIREYASLN